MVCKVPDHELLGGEIVRSCAVVPGLVQVLLPCRARHLDAVEAAALSRKSAQADALVIAISPFNDVWVRIHV